MGVLEQVFDLQNKGVPENDIINTLKEQGVSPRAINDALSQAKIKSAVSSENTDEYTSGQMQPSILRPEKAEGLPTEGSLSDEDLTPPVPSRYMNPMMAHPGPVTKEISEETDYVPQEQTQQPNYPHPQYSYGQAAPSQPQQYYQEYDYQPTDYNSSPTGVSDTDTLIEVSEQVFSEKIKPMQKQLEDVNEFKTLTQTKVENMSERLKRLESSIDRLQSAILEKIGDYGRGLDSVKKEMEMMQNSFGKVVNTLADKSEHKHHTHHTNQSKSMPTHTTHKSHKTTHVIHHKSSSGKKKTARRKTSKKK